MCPILTYRKLSLVNAGVRGNGLEIGERLDIAIDVAHGITYLHMYTGMCHYN